MSVQEAGEATFDGFKSELPVPTGNYRITELDNLNYDMEQTHSWCNDRANSNIKGTTAIVIYVPSLTQTENAPTVVNFTNTPRETNVPSDGSAVINGMKQESKDGPFTLYFEPKKGLGQKTPDNTDPSTPSN